MIDESAVCVATFSSELEADMAPMSLDSNGIDSFISKDDCGDMRPWLQPVTGVRLTVRETEAKRLSETLEEMNRQRAV